MTESPGRTPPPEGAGGASGTPHALRRLEFARVLDVVAEGAASGAGARRVRALRPLGGAAACREALRAADEMVGLLLRDSGWSPPRTPEVEGTLRRLGVEGSVLEAAELVEVATLLASSRRARGELRRDPETFPRLAALGGEMLKAPAEEEELTRSFDASGGVADSASPTLKRLRRSLREGRAELVARLERFAGSLPDRLRVADASVTVRGGRYCLPIRREGMSEVGGIVHDESATQRTIFVEPPLAIEPNNRVRELELEEAREVNRILRRLTERVRPLAPGLLSAFDALARADALWAVARYALGHGGARPEILEAAPADPAPQLRLVGAAHPLLLAAGEEVVPLDLTMGPEETVLLVSGPNAGGKTVLLKTVGLICAMAQSGILPPVGPGTRLPFFRRIFAVIGDEQSLEASLSTFSAQLAHLREMLEQADRGSLVLVDEIGAATDPAEGSALAAAVLRRLAGQARLTLATTHLGELKALAGEDPRIVNGSMQFDTAALRPTFRLIRDRPGRSYALEIARRIGLPEEILEEARARLSAHQREVDDVLAGLERKETELARLEAETRVLRGALERRERALSGREARQERRAAALDRRERTLEREAREREARYLREARQAVETEIERLREAVGGEGAGEAGPEGAEAAFGAARSAVEARLREARERRPPPPAPPGPPPRLREGQWVEAPALGLRGRVREVREGEVVVEVGGLRVSVPGAELREATPRGPGSEPEPPPPAGPERRPEIVPRPEVDLRGLRVDEVEAALVPALDAAVAGDLPRLRIIHGKGTGAVRERVREILEGDRRVAGFRAGAFEEGGSGVTVVEFGGTRTGG